MGRRVKLSAHHAYRKGGKVTVRNSELKTDIMIHRRDSFIKYASQPLRLAIILYGKKFPEPTRENCKNPVALVLLDIWDEFFELEDNPGRDALFKALRRISVGTIETMDYYEQRFTWFLMKLTMAYMDGRWQPNLPCSPFAHWKDTAVIEAKDKAIEDFIINHA